MTKLNKKWMIVAAVMAGMMFQLGGCFGGQWTWIWAILNEEVFG